MLNLEDINVGDVYQGVVDSVCDFGAFVDIGYERKALLHIAYMAHGEFVKDPYERFKAGELINVKIVRKDDRGRINVSFVSKV